jgi:hypothetical protein
MAIDNIMASTYAQFTNDSKKEVFAHIHSWMWAVRSGKQKSSIFTFGDSLLDLYIIFGAYQISESLPIPA